VFPLRKDPLSLYAIRNIPSPATSASAFKAVSGQKFIGSSRTFPTRKALDRILKENDVNVQHVMEFDNIETVKRAVEI